MKKMVTMTIMGGKSSSPLSPLGKLSTLHMCHTAYQSPHAHVCMANKLRETVRSDTMLRRI